MRKMLVAGIILGIIAFSWGYEGRAVDRVCTDMITRLTLLEQYLTQDRQTVMHAAQEVNQSWNEHEKVMEIFIPHDDTDSVNIKQANLMGCIETENYNRALIVIRELKAHFAEIQKKSHVGLKNIF